METKELRVIRADKGLGNAKPVYIVEYNGKEQRVSMFNFQKDRPVPATIRCIVENNALKQDYRTLMDEFYEAGKSYLFRIKARRDSLRYYELEDDRLEGDNLALNLSFTNSFDNLEVAKIVQCQVTELTDKKPLLVLVDANPSLIKFLSLEAVFGPDRSVQAWLETIFTEGCLQEAAELYGKADGRWICFFAKEMERIIYSLLLSRRADKENILINLCAGWVNTVEHSSFMAKLSGKEKKQEYVSWLTRSIEVCEDCKDALSLSEKEEKVKEIISTLNPDYYQYRPERRLRFLSCIFSLCPEVLKRNMAFLLEQIGCIGEEECSSERIYISIKSLLLMCFNVSADQWMDRLSIPNEAIREIKFGILSLCYLIKIMLRRGEKEAVGYASRLYVLLSLCANDDKESVKALKNAYKCLFSDIRSVFHFKWESLDSIVRSGLYLFGRDNISADQEKSLIYDNRYSCCELSANEIRLYPCNYRGGWTDFKVSDGLGARVCYNKSLSRLETEGDFLSVRNAWKDVHNTFFSPVKRVEQRNPVLVDGNAVDIYITKIADNRESALCKAVGYEEEGIISFRNLFFYARPSLTLEDFTGTDGTPLVFPAICENADGNIAFMSEPYKKEYAYEMLEEGTEVECSVIQENKNDKSGKYPYICVTEQELFIFLSTDGRKLECGALVRVTITKMLNNGNAQACLEEVIKENGHSYGKEAYVSYLKGFNQWRYGEEMTLQKMEEQDAETLAPANYPSRRRTSTGEIEMQCIAHILARLSEFEKNPRRRYGYLFISSMLAHLIGDGRYEDLLGLHMKFVEVLYNFSLNNRLQESDLTDFAEAAADRLSASSEAKEMINILSILSKVGNRCKHHELDKTLLGYLEGSAPVEKELARLILSNNLLSNFHNLELQDRVLDEIGNIVRVDVVKSKKVHIGEEGQTQEFKTSLVFPPNNGGNEDLERQSENILRVIFAMMNAKGGVLYIGVNDDGNVVGLYDDLHYFADSATAYNEMKAKDKFENHFSCMLANSIGAENASKFNYGFEEHDGYNVFRVEIPVLYVDENNLYRVGNTVQEKR